MSWIEIQSHPFLFTTLLWIQAIQCSISGLYTVFYLIFSSVFIRVSCFVFVSGKVSSICSSRVTWWPSFQMCVLMPLSQMHGKFSLFAKDKVDFSSGSNPTYMLSHWRSAHSCFTAVTAIFPLSHILEMNLWYTVLLLNRSLFFFYRVTILMK